ncbi:MAG: Gfo/Idh/MocA family oxidoreductase [Cyclobacteriaceae bacterium]
MSKGRIRLGTIGGGYGSFMGIVHRIASYMGENYEIVCGAFDVNYEKGLEFSAQLGVDDDRSYPDIDTLIEKELALSADKRVEAVSILTPNFLHYEMAKKLVSAGINVICEKPITVTAAEAEELEKLVAENGVTFALTHTYTGYPMVRQMKAMIAEGAIGKVQKVDAQYYQGWINPFIHDEEKRKPIWRLDPKVSGKSCCMGDIGVHAFNLIEYTTGQEVDKVLSDLNTLYDNNPLDVDGSTLVRMKSGAKGVITASQIATGEENNIVICVYGEKAGLRWEQENPTYLKYMIEGEPARILKPGNAYNHEFSLESTKIAPGHPEGLFDAMANIYMGAAKAIREEKYHEGAFPTVVDGVRGMKFIEAVLKSNKEGQTWINV